MTSPDTVRRICPKGKGKGPKGKGKGYGPRTRKTGSANYVSYDGDGEKVYYDDTTGTRLPTQLVIEARKDERSTWITMRCTKNVMWKKLYG